MARPWLYRILESPRVYNAAQFLLAPGSRRDLERLYAESFGSSRGLVLEVGSGPTPETPLPNGALVALDVNPSYVSQFLEITRAGSCPTSGVVASAGALPFRNGAFDECRSVFVLHHLRPELVRKTLAEMLRIVRPGGQVIVFDMVRPRSFLPNPVAWLIARFDRGEWVRRENELRKLTMETSGPAWNLRKFAYSWFRLRGVILTRTR